MQIDRLVMQIGAGEVLLIPPRTLHAVTVESVIDMIVIHFEDLSREEDVYLRPPCVLRPSKSSFTRLVASAHEVLTHALAGTRAASIIASGHIQAILGILGLEDTERTDESIPGDTSGWTTTQKAIRIMHERFADPALSITDVAEAVGLSSNYFSTSFRNIVGAPPLEYLRRLRVDEAKYLLMNSPLTVSEVAQRTGFRGLEYFTKVFRKVEGVPPTTWRATTGINSNSGAHNPN